jgi:hypothetical protein
LIFELSIPNCLGLSKLHSRLQFRFEIASTMLAVYGLNAWCVVHETSNACMVFIIWLFSVDYDAWRGLVDYTWGCSVDGVVAILLVLTIVALREVCNVPIWCRSLSRELLGLPQSLPFSLWMLPCLQ